MTPATFHILLSLADSEKHGYAIMREVEERTEGKVRIGPGTLYGAIQRLEEEGLVEETESRRDPALDDERRRYYKLTRAGRRALAEEAGRLRSMVRMAAAKGMLRSES